MKSAVVVRFTPEATAERQAARSTQVAQFLTEMLESVGLSKALGRDITMLREILDKTAARVGKDLANQPEVQIELWCTLLKHTRSWVYVAKRTAWLVRRISGSHALPSILVGPW